MFTANRGSAWTSGTDLLYADPTPVEPKAPVGRWQGPALPPIQGPKAAPVERPQPKPVAIDWYIESPSEARASSFQENWQFMWGHS